MQPGICTLIKKTISNCSKHSVVCHLDCVHCELMLSKSCSLLVSGFCLEADYNLCTSNLSQLVLGAQQVISMTCFSGGTSRANKTCIRALTHVSQLWVVLLLLCPTVHIMSLREEVNGIAHVTITKEVLRIVAYLNEEVFFFVMHLLVKQCRTATERKAAVFSLSALGSLTPAPGLNITGAAAEKTGCMGPCTQPACGAAWRTAMETRSVTGSGGIRHSCRHFLFDRLMKTSLPHHAQQQQLLEKKCDQTMLTAVWLKCSLASL